MFQAELFVEKEAKSYRLFYIHSVQYGWILNVLLEGYLYYGEVERFIKIISKKMDFSYRKPISRQTKGMPSLMKYFAL